MRNMTEKEIRDFIEEWTWGTIVAVNDDPTQLLLISQVEIFSMLARMMATSSTS